MYYVYSHHCTNEAGVKLEIQVTFYEAANLIEWRIKDVIYKPNGKKNSIHMKRELEEQFRCLGNTYNEKEDMITQAMIEFVGKQNAIDAFNAAWQDIQPNIAEIIGSND